MAYILILVVILLLAALMPFVGIFALNLLGLSIPYTASTWLGMLLLLLLLNSNRSGNKR